VFKNVLPPEFNPHEDTLLDVGCGIGDLWAYCVEILKCDAPMYTGIDLDAEIIELARKKFPTTTFYNEALNGFTTTKYDWIVAVSAFNEISKFPVDIKQTIELMYENANKGIALNLMHTHLNESDKESLQVFDPKEIIDWALSKYDNVKFHKNYINRDFYLCIYK
jgi:cyclopropane fatty-acyl-phospholipid synthase-like methyltransferase